jgi:hypothetical protein
MLKPEKLICFVLVYGNPELGRACLKEYKRSNSAASKITGLPTTVEVATAKHVEDALSFEVGYALDRCPYLPLTIFSRK